MASSFEMEPEGTRVGLASAGITRTSAASTPPPTSSTTDHYTAGFLTASSALLGASLATVASHAEKGLSAAAVTVTTMEDAESYNANSLKT